MALTDEDIQHKLLYRCLSEKRWRLLDSKSFYQRYEEEVGELSDFTQGQAADLPLFGVCTIYQLPDGLTALEEPNGKWSLYESEERARSRDHFKAWSEFARGQWTLRCPMEPGLYFVKDKDLGKRSVRELKVVNGRLKDVTGGPVRVGLVTEWQGYWYVPVIPPLRDSF